MAYKFTAEEIKDIAEDLDCGMKIYYHKESGKVLKFIDPDQFGDAEEFFAEELEELENNFMDYVEIESMHSSDSYEVMLDFAQEISDLKFKNRLLFALEKRKPFREFKYLIDESDYREDWFAFKAQRYIEWTARQVNRQIFND